MYQCYVYGPAAHAVAVGVGAQLASKRKRFKKNSAVITVLRYIQPVAEREMLREDRATCKSLNTILSNMQLGLG